MQFPAIKDTTYHIESEIGSGSGGTVYKAWHERLKKYVVLKRIKDESGILQTSRQRIEADILKNLKHSYLPQLYDFLSESSGTYTVMEFIPGLSFHEILESGRRFEQKQVVRWAEQLSSALAYLHSQKPSVLHSDIKPRNIMLTPDDNLCLIDFNISLVLDGDSAEVLGLSHGYASPEQYGPQGLPSEMQIAPKSRLSSQNDQFPDKTEKIDTSGILDSNSQETDYPTQSVITNSGSQLPAFERVSSHHSNNSVDMSTELIQQQSPPSSSEKRRTKIRMDARSDIYSVGATLYHLITGEKPAIATGNIKPLSEFNLPISKALIYIIERCMEHDPSKRFQTATDLYDAVVNIHKIDGRWKRQHMNTLVATIIISALFVTFSTTAALGWYRMAAEKKESYNNLVLGIATDESDSSYETAIVLFPEDPYAYREQAKKMNYMGRYEECIKYVEYVMAKLTAYPHKDTELITIGDIYYVQGNAFFELEDYPNSLASYESALANNPDNPETYRDYAIALARSGFIDQAEELLDEIKYMDYGIDSINLLRGEIAYAKNNNQDAVTLFKEVITETNNDYIRNRAYLICDKTYRRESGQIQNEIALLQNALNDLPANYLLVIKERLADAMVRNGDYTEAVKLFTEIRQGGNISYQTWQNIGVLHQQMGDFANARMVYTELLAAYPDDYRPPLRLAFLVLEEQSKLKNENREYADVVRYYEQAHGLCNTDDVEMAQLSGLISELRRNGWI